MLKTAAHLSETHEREISRYLREVGEHLRILPADERGLLLVELRTRIDRELEKSPDGTSDELIAAIIRRCGPPESQAARLLRARSQKQRTWLNWDERIWLGVCGAIARNVDIDPRIVRFTAVTLGLVPFILPFVLIAYLSTYFWIYFAKDRGHVTPIQPVPLVKAVLAISAVAALLHAGSGAILWLIEVGYSQLLEQPLQYAARWGWLPHWRGYLLFWALMYCLPVRLVAALPVTANWDSTLRKTAHAGMALYAVVLCFGVASALTGAILRAVHQLPDGPNAAALLGLFQ